MAVAAQHDPGEHGLFETIANLAAFHREHEKFYASAPREQAVRLQRHARTLQALGDRWSTTAASEPMASNPFAGAEDLNAPVALQLDGVLFMEGEGEPAEITKLVGELRSAADESLATGGWLDAAMAASWEVAAGTLDVPALADLLGDRHRIIANDWQAATMSSLAGRLLGRAADVLDRVDFTPAALRSDLRGDRRSARLVLSAAELVDRAADLLSDSAGLLHDNEPRWRRFRQRVTSP